MYVKLQFKNCIRSEVLRIWEMIGHFFYMPDRLRIKDFILKNKGDGCSLQAAKLTSLASDLKLCLQRSKEL